MLQVDARIDEARQKIDEWLAMSEALLKQIPEELTVEENVNQKPFSTPVYTGGQQGWLALRLLIDFDRLARNILLASHVALMSRGDSYDFLRAANRELRSLCAFPQRYPGYSGVNRDDFAANNAKAREAREKFGDVPKEVLEGTVRSPYAPMIQKPSTSAPLPNDQGAATGSDANEEPDLYEDLNDDDEPSEDKDTDTEAPKS